MREILFRGKELDCGDWVEGYLIRNDSICYPALFIGMIEASRTRYGELSIDGHYLPQVDPDTVGQYTGLKDKNGKRIFEGDIVMFLDYTEPAFVVWDQEDARWYMHYSDCMLDFSYRCVPSAIEVIGNVHDHPELIAEVNRNVDQ